MAFKSAPDSAEENLGVENASRGGAELGMKRTVERFGPLVPAIATAGASVCVSSLLLATGPQTLGPQSVVLPLTREAGRVVASLSPPASISSVGRGPVAPSADRRSLSSPARRPSPSAPPSHRPSTQVSPVGASPPPPQLHPSPPPTPPATGPTASSPAVQASTSRAKPGWGYGDPNHDHTGPPGKGANGRKSQTASAATDPPTRADGQNDSVQHGEKKSTGSPGKPAGDRKDQTTSASAQPPAVTPDEHGSVQSGEKKSTGR